MNTMENFDKIVIFFWKMGPWGDRVPTAHWLPLKSATNYTERTEAPSCLLRVQLNIKEGPFSQVERAS